MAFKKKQKKNSLESAYFSAKTKALNTLKDNTSRDNIEKALDHIQTRLDGSLSFQYTAKLKAIENDPYIPREKDVIPTNNHSSIELHQTEDGDCPIIGAEEDGGPLTKHTTDDPPTTVSIHKARTIPHSRTKMFRIFSMPSRHLTIF